MNTDISELLARIYEDRAALLSDVRKRESKGVRLGKEYLRRSLLNSVLSKQGKRVSRAREIKDILAEARTLTPRERRAYISYEDLANILLEARNALVLSHYELEASYYKILAIFTARELPDNKRCEECYLQACNAGICDKGRAYGKLCGAARSVLALQAIISLLGTLFWKGEELLNIATLPVEVSFIVEKYNRLIKKYVVDPTIARPLDKAEYIPDPVRLRGISERLASVDVYDRLGFKLGELYKALIPEKE